MAAGAPDGTQLPAGIDYQITAADNLETFGGPKTRYKNNMAALRTLKQIQAEGRRATPAEQKILARFSGWGESTLANQLFEPGFKRVKPEWQNEWRELRELLTPEEFKTAAKTVVNAHYTRPAVIRPLYAALERLGVGNLNQIRFLEPAVGIGNILGLMPANWLDKTQRVAVELDPVTAALTRELYQRARVLPVGFQQAPLADGYFDVTFTNVPFGDYGVFDPLYKARQYKYLTGSIHNYYFAKMLDKTRPGGLVVAITSRYTMDSLDPRVRALIAERADLLGAIRLPQSTFKQNAGTEVVTDVLFLRKRLPGEAPAGQPWLKTLPRDVDSLKAVPINEYYDLHPANVLGSHSDQGKMYGKDTYTVLPSGDNIEEQIAQAVQNLPANVITPRVATGAAVDELDAALQIRQQGLKEGALIIRDGALMRVAKDALVPVVADAKLDARLRSLIAVKDELATVRQAQLNGADDATLAAAQAQFQRVYAAHVKQYGKVGDRANLQAFAGDPELYHFRTLERPDGSLADIVTKRLVSGETIPSRIENATDALAVTLRSQGRLDIDYLQRLTGKEQPQLIAELGDLIFQDPNGGWLTQDAYLSGNVREKLRHAEAAAVADPAYQRNVDALRTAQPKDLLPSQITVRLGDNWIPPAVLQRFYQKTFGEALDITYHQELGWRLGKITETARNSVGSAKWGSGRVKGADLFDHAVMNSAPKVYDEYEVWDAVANKNKIVKELNVAATNAAHDAIQALHEEFQRWLWESDLAPEMVNRYNQIRNVWVGGHPNGAHLPDRLPGMSLDFFTLRPNQKNAIWRVLTRGNTLIAHEVGAGKTATMFGIAMEWKRTGMANKVLMVAPNELIAQHEAAFRAQYPMARIIAPNMTGLDGPSRKALMAEVANNDWDLVLLPQSQLRLLPLSKTYEQAYVQKELDLWYDILAAERNKVASTLSDKVKDREKAIDNDPTVKRIMRNIQQYETRIQTMQAMKRDNVVDFEELGIDAILVDEAHEYKNLPFATSAGMIEPGDAERAIDMHMKVEYINQQSNHRNTVFATGTPLTNSIAETWTMMRYLMPHELETQLFGTFDPWGGAYGKMAPKWELDVATGEWKIKSRFADFNNAQELHAMWQNTMDVMRWSDMPWLKLPEVKGGGRQVITAEATPVYQQIQAELAARAKAIAARKGPPKKGDDIKLAIINDANAAAVDVRLYNPRLPDQPNSKTNQMVKEALRLYEQSTPHKGAQLIFADIGVPGGAKEFNLYEDIKQKLVAGGIPAQEIAFIQDAKDDIKKLAIFEQVNRGEIRILIGSTGAMGKGANMQKRLIGLHHLSGKYRPDEVLQREGRIVRVGNLFADLGIPVEIFVYVQQPLDAFMWGRVESKVRSINKLVQRELLDRTLTEIDEEELSFAMIAAAAGGDPRMFRLRELESEVSKLKGLYHQHLDRAYQLRADANAARRQRKEAESILAIIEQRYKPTLSTYEGSYAVVDPLPKGYRGYGDATQEVIAAAMTPRVAALNGAANLKDYKGELFNVNLFGSQWSVTPRVTEAIQFAPRGAGQADEIKHVFNPEWYVIWEPAHAAPGRTTTFVVPIGGDPVKDAKSLTDRMRRFVQQDLGELQTDWTNHLAPLKTKAEELEALTSAPFPRYQELQERAGELESLRTEINGNGNTDPGAPAAVAAAADRSKWPLLKAKDLSIASRLNPRSDPNLGSYPRFIKANLDGRLWYWRQGADGSIVAQQGSTPALWTHLPTDYWDKGEVDPGPLRDAIALTDDTIDLRPVATHKPDGWEEKTVVLADANGNLAFIHARDYAMVLNAATNNTWRTEGVLRWTKRPGQSVVARINDEAVMILPTYRLPEELEGLRPQLYPGSQPGLVTMYGGLGTIDPRPALAPYAQRVRGYLDRILHSADQPAPPDPTFPQMAAHQLKTLDEWGQALRQALPSLRQPLPNNLNLGQKAAITQYVDNVLLPAFDNTVLGSSYMAEKIANGAMLNYNDRRGIDTLISLAIPYHYYATRGGLSWAQRFVRKPSLINLFGAINQAIAIENERGTLPDRLKGTFFTYRDANGQYRLRNPLEWLLPIPTTFADRWRDPEARTNAGVQWANALADVNLLPAYSLGLGAILDQVDPRSSGPSRTQEDLELRRYLPQVGVLADAYQAGTGQFVPWYAGGNYWDHNRARRSLADLATLGQLGATDAENKARVDFGAQLAHNLERNLPDRYYNIPPNARDQAEADLQLAAQNSGQQRALSSATGLLLGNTAYYLPAAEVQRLGEVDTRQQMKYDATGQDGIPIGSNAAYQAAATPGTVGQTAITISPGEREPGVVAMQRAYYDQRDAIYAAMQQAKDAAILANPSITKGQMAQTVTDPYYARLEELDIAANLQAYQLANPNATPDQIAAQRATLEERVANNEDLGADLKAAWGSTGATQPPLGSDPRERAVWLLEQQLDVPGKPTYPPDGASKAEFAKYYAALDAWKLVRNETIQSRLGKLLGFMITNPNPDLIRMFQLINGMAVDDLLLEFQTLKFASEIEKDWQRGIAARGSSGGGGGGYRSSYRRRYYPRRSYGRRSYGGYGRSYGGGGWGGGSGYTKTPYPPDVYAREFDRNLWNVYSELRKWQPANFGEGAERWRPSRYDRAKLGG